MEEEGAEEEDLEQEDEELDDDVLELLKQRYSSKEEEAVHKPASTGSAGERAGTPGANTSG